MMHTLYEIALMAWHVLLVMLKVSAAVSVIAVLLIMIAYGFWPEWETSDPDPQLAKRLHEWPADGFVSGPAADATVDAWEEYDATRLMVEDACLRLHKGSKGQYFTAQQGRRAIRDHDRTPNSN